MVHTEMILENPTSLLKLVSSKIALLFEVSAPGLRGDHAIPDHGHLPAQRPGPAKDTGMAPQKNSFPAK
jgi:hypothetical protein